MRPEIDQPPAVLSTTQAARMCQVDRRTMLRWVDGGLLPHHQTGGGQRRILPADLAAFMHERGMPVPSKLDPGPVRVAVVDDDVGFVASMVRFLASEIPGADIRTASDGFAAGLLLSSFRPQLVLLDLVMPGMDGYEVLRRIRQRPELTRTAVVVVSGTVTPDLSASLLAQGASAALPKPADPARLRNLIRKIIPRSANKGGTPWTSKRSWT